MYDEMKRQEELLRTSSLSFLNQDWRYSNINDDPTASRDQSLDRNKLIDIEKNINVNISEHFITLGNKKLKL